MRVPALLVLLAVAGCEPSGSSSTLVFTIEDDQELFTDADHDGISTSCADDPSRPEIEMKRGLFHEDEGPLFHVQLRFDPTGAEPDEGVSLSVEELAALDVSYHGSTWPTDAGTVTVTDWVALDEVIRMSVSLEGVGNGSDISLDGAITCVR
ncbi:MAG: hypothetical protein V4850_24635 [Myxococcota bacterium]